MPRNWDELVVTKKTKLKAVFVEKRFIPSVEQLSILTDKLCIQRCKAVPEHITQCKGRNQDGGYTCRTRLLSDNINFELEKGWIDIATHHYNELLEEVKGNDKATTSTT